MEREPGLNKKARPKQTVNNNKSKPLRSLYLSRNSESIACNWPVVCNLDLFVNRTEGTQLFNWSNLCGLTHPNMEWKPGLNKQ